MKTKRGTLGWAVAMAAVLSGAGTVTAPALGGLVVAAPDGGRNVRDPGNTWRDTASMHVAREGGGAGNGDLAAVLHDGRVLVAGGFNTEATADVFTFLVEENYLRDAEVYDPTQGTWTRTGSMNERRFGPALVTLPSGKVLSAGGYGGGAAHIVPFGSLGKFHRTAELYDPATGSWAFTGSMRDCRAGGTPSLLPNGTVLFVGGLGCDGASQNTVEVYDPRTETWSPAASMRDARFAHSATALPDGRLLVAGGQRLTTTFETTVLGTAEIYDPATNRWTQASPLGVARAFHSAALLSTGKVVVAGGKCPPQRDEVLDQAFAPSCATPTAELFDPATGTWAATGSMSAPRVFSGSVVLPRSGPRGERFLVAGGGQQASGELYDPATGTWSLTGPMAVVHDDAPAVLLGSGEVLIAGGFQVEGNFYRNTARAELYTPPRSGR